MNRRSINRNSGLLPGFFFLPENHPNPLDQNAAEMSFGLLEMSFGVLEMSFGVLEMSFEDIEVGFCALEISYGYQW